MLTNRFLQQHPLTPRLQAERPSTVLIKSPDDTPLLKLNKLHIYQLEMTKENFNFPKCPNFNVNPLQSCCGAPRDLIFHIQTQ